MQNKPTRLIFKSVNKRHSAKRIEKLKFASIELVSRQYQCKCQLLTVALLICSHSAKLAFHQLQDDSWRLSLGRADDFCHLRGCMRGCVWRYDNKWRATMQQADLETENVRPACQ